MDLTLVYLISYCLFLLLAGYFIPFLHNRPLTRMVAWTVAVITVLFSISITSSAPPLWSMIIIVSLQLLSMKMLVMVETYSDRNKLTFIQWLAFSLGWFGMRPVLFEHFPAKPLGYAYLALKGLTRILAGFLLLYASWIVETSLGNVFFLPALLLLAGLSLILHFGILNLSAAAWRSMGVDVPELFRSPYKSKSLREFWGKRWNIAFSEMTALIAYRPLKSKIGIEKAVVISFLLSGLLHEIAISFPVRSGYGLPLLYFAIHAALMYLEGRSVIVKKIAGHSVFSHIWVMAALIVPMPLLFHHEFIQSVLIPLRDILLQQTGIL